ncbi:MAG: hypothetical protein JXB50_09665 [Spirochaetes bacterium]|nr:hypothetical protein [Spirochaetota bacterium]
MHDKKEIKSKLLEIEQEFYSLKEKINKFHKFYIILYFTPPVLALVIINNYFQKYFKLSVKIILFSIIILGLLIHFYLRHKYYKSKNKYKKFIMEKMNLIKINFDNEIDFKDKLIKSIKEIFDERGIDFNNIEINNSTFFNLVFIYLGLESE